MVSAQEERRASLVALGLWHGAAQAALTLNPNPNPSPSPSPSPNPNPIPIPTHTRTSNLNQAAMDAAGVTDPGACLLCDDRSGLALGVRSGVGLGLGLG